MILVLTEPADAHADHLIPLLQARGEEVVRFNPADFPSRASLSLGYGLNGKMRSMLRTDGATVDLTEIRSVWSRRPKAPVPHDGIVNAAAREFVAQECRTVVQDIWDALTCPWLPGKPTAIHRAQFKLSQLRLAAELGFELPPTLVTTSREEFLEFYGAHNGNVITKHAGYALDHAVQSRFVNYTELVSKRDVCYASSIELCPSILQAYIPKSVELRITVVGRRAFAAEIHSQQTRHTRYDWRRYDLDHTPHFAHELPVDVRERCIRLCERLDLCYGAIDMIVTPDGRYVFLEINPSGQYLWIEEETGLPISEAICDLLVAGQGVGHV